MVQAMFPTREQEIDDFKRRINLTEYAAAQGYALDRKESSRNSVTMRGPGDDKIIIGKDANSGHWIYFSVRDDADNGTIIDFIQNRQRFDLGEVRKALRPKSQTLARGLCRRRGAYFQRPCPDTGTVRGHAAGSRRAPLP